MLKIRDCAFQDGSYPCGYEDGGKLPDCELCHKIRKAGIREVVKFVEGGSHLKRAIDMPNKHYRIPTWELEAKLKEWGIDNA